MRTYARIGWESFGGPAGQIAVMHRVLVEEKRWIPEERFLHALNFCMLLPGPEATQLVTYVGWLLHGARGGLAAGVLFVLPGFLSILALSVLYARYRDVGFVQSIFFGIKAAVLAVVVEAVVRIGRRTLHTPPKAALALASFAAIHLLNVSFAVVVLAAGALGLLFAPRRAKHGEGSGSPRPPPGRSLRVAAIGLGLWFAPVAACLLVLGPGHVFTQLGVFFSKAAVVTFGGAYAVLAYVAQAAVERYAWLRPGEMLDGLGLAETTPGPLIMVVQFVAFVGADRMAGGIGAGVLASCLVTWVTFVPCFLWIFLFAPYVEALRGNRWWGAALSAITAAVVGAVLDLAVYFARHAIFPAGGVDWAAAGIAVGAAVALLRFRVPLGWVIAASAAAGLL